MRRPYSYFSENETNYYRVPIWHRTVDFWKRKAKRMPLPDHEFMADEVKGQHPAKYDPVYRKRRSMKTLGAFRSPLSIATGGPVTPGAPYRENEVAALRNKTILRVSSKLRAYPINLAVALGEYRATADFFCETAGAVVRSYRALRRGNVYEALKVLRGRDKDYQKWLSSRWLQWKYAVKPLMMDVYGACEALDTRDQIGHIIPLRTTFRKQLQVSDISDTTGFSGTCTADIRCRARLTARITDPLMFRLDQTGIFNPALIVWELIPFSFVIDWFVPVGNWLENVRPPQGVTVSGTLTTRVFGTSQATYWRERDGFSLSCSQVQMNTHREVLTGLPTPKLTPPELKPTFDRLVTTMALLRATRS